MYVYIWENANPCKLTFAWLVFSLGFRFVYVQEVEKYLCNKKWKVVIHIAKYFTTWQKALMHSRQLYCTADGFTAQQKALMHSRKLYCTAESYTAQQTILLHSRKFYRIVEKSVLRQKLEKSSFCGRNWRKVPFAAEIEDKPTLQRLPLDLDSTFAHKLAAAKWYFEAHSAKRQA